MPPAGAYPSRRNALDGPTKLEQEMLDLINADRAEHRDPALKWQALLSAVAREHAADMAEHDYVAYFSPRLGSFDYRLHRAGVSAPNARYAIFRAGSLKRIMGNLKRDARPFHRRMVTHVGIGVVAKGLVPRMVYVTLIACEKHSTLEPFPTKPVYGEGYWLAGRLERGFKDAKVIVTVPSGRVVAEPLELDANMRFKTIVSFDQGPGRYVVEVTASGKLGPAVLEMMHCYAGVSYPDPPPERRRLPTPRDLREAERLMSRMVNRARMEAGLSRLDYGEDLAAVGRAHSNDMARHGFFAHVSPTRGTLADRMRRAGIAVATFSENLAGNADLGAAHEGLMDSPGHRKNILDPDVNRVGIGIVRTGEGNLIITQVFARDYPTYDTEALAEEFLAAANKARASRGMRPLTRHKALARIARENTRAMKADGKQGYKTAQSMLKRERLPMSVQIGVFQSTYAIRPDQVKPVLEQGYRHAGIAIVQSEAASGEKFLWTTILVGKQ